MLNDRPRADGSLADLFPGHCYHQLQPTRVGNEVSNWSSLIHTVTFTRWIEVA